VRAFCTFSIDTVEVLREAARLFRESGVLEGVQMQGIVIHLSRSPRELEGTATVFGSVEGKGRRILVLLSGSAYDLVIEAHRTQRPIAFEADIVREGRTYTALNVRDLRLVALAVLWTRASL
jgi:hypothetical protein